MKWSFPPLTRACVLGFLSLSVGGLLLRYSLYSSLSSGIDENQTAPKFSDIKIAYLTLIPSRSLSYPWVLILSSFVEQSIFGFLVTGSTLAFAGRYCERVWGSKHLAIFLIIQSIIPNLLSWLTIYFLFIITKNESDLFQSINGGIGLQLGFLVAFKQLVPEHVLVLFKGLLKIQVKYLIFPVLIIYTVVGIVFSNVIPIVLCWSGFFSSWIYLRFYKISYSESILPGDNSSQRTKIRGDASDTFALAKFFYPRPLTNIISSISKIVFPIFVSLRICTPFNEEEVEAGNFNTNLRTRGSVSANRSDADSDRRRALALKELGSRLEQTQQQPNPVSTPPS